MSKGTGASSQHVGVSSVSGVYYIRPTNKSEVSSDKSLRRCSVAAKKTSLLTQRSLDR